MAVDRLSRDIEAAAFLPVQFFNGMNVYCRASLEL